MNLLKDVKNLVSGSTNKSSGGDEEWFITAESATGISDLGGLSKSDPYLKIEFGGKSVRTRTVKNDRSPSWNETFNFKVNSGSAKEIVLKLVDDDIGMDDTIGTATVRKDELPSYSGEEKYLKVPILRKEQINGVVHLRVKKIVDGQQGQQQQYQQQSYQQQQQYQQPNQQQHYQQHQQFQQTTQPYQQSNQQPQQQQQFNQNPNSNSNYYGQQR
jgi:hypothetical protein